MSEVSEGRLASEKTSILELLHRELNSMKIILEKSDTEEQRLMAKALLANKLVRAIEIQGHSSQKVQKSDSEVHNAVVDVVSCFGVSTQWTAVYRVLVDFCGWESDVAKFTLRMNMLLNDVHIGYRCTYQSIQKPLANNGILRKDYQEWKKYCVPKGDRVFSRQLFVAKKLLKLLSIGI